MFTIKKKTVYQWLAASTSALIVTLVYFMTPVFIKNIWSTSTDSYAIWVYFGIFLPTSFTVTWKVSGIFFRDTPQKLLKTVETVPFVDREDTTNALKKVVKDADSKTNIWVYGASGSGKSYFLTHFIDLINDDTADFKNTGAIYYNMSSVNSITDFSNAEELTGLLKLKGNSPSEVSKKATIRRFNKLIIVFDQVTENKLVNQLVSLFQSARDMNSKLVLVFGTITPPEPTTPTFSGKWEKIDIDKHRFKVLQIHALFQKKGVTKSLISDIEEKNLIEITNGLPFVIGTVVQALANKKTSALDQITEKLPTDSTQTLNNFIEDYFAKQLNDLLNDDNISVSVVFQIIAECIVNVSYTLPQDHTYFAMGKELSNYLLGTYNNQNNQSRSVRIHPLLSNIIEKGIFSTGYSDDFYKACLTLFDKYSTDESKRLMFLTMSGPNNMLEHLKVLDEMLANCYRQDRFALLGRMNEISSNLLKLDNHALDKKVSDQINYAQVFYLSRSGRYDEALNYIKTQVSGGYVSSLGDLQTTRDVEIQYEFANLTHYENHFEESLHQFQDLQVALQVSDKIDSETKEIMKIRIDEVEAHINGHMGSCLPACAKQYQFAINEAANYSHPDRVLNEWAIASLEKMGVELTMLSRDDMQQYDAENAFKVIQTRLTSAGVSGEYQETIDRAKRHLALYLRKANRNQEALNLLLEITKDFEKNDSRIKYDAYFGLADFYRTARQGKKSADLYQKCLEFATPIHNVTLSTYAKIGITLNDLFNLGQDRKDEKYFKLIESALNDAQNAKIRTNELYCQLILQYLKDEPVTANLIDNLKKENLNDEAYLLSSSGWDNLGKFIFELR